jgi:glutamate carboxypeptidase
LDQPSTKFSIPDQLDLSRIVSILESSLPYYLRDLKHLVNIDSGTYDKAGVDEVAALLESKYRALGCRTETHAHDTFGATVLARQSGRGKGRILLLGHTDTVFPAGTATQRPFRIEGDRAFGPGVADMKAGDLSILFALQVLDELGSSDYAELIVVHNADEEIGSPSSAEIIKREAQSADVALVLEPGRENGNIVSARKGVAFGTLRVSGKAAHAGVNKEAGRSAALELAHLVIALENLNGKLPDLSVNIGRLESGDRVNVVPDRGVATFEARAYDTYVLEECGRRIRDIASHRTIDGTQAEVEYSMGLHPMHKSAAIARLVVLAQELAARLGFCLEDMATGGGSDGNTAAATGTPVLDALGPIGGAAHSENEYLMIPSIVPRTALLAGLIAVLGQGQLV